MQPLRRGGGSGVLMGRVVDDRNPSLRDCLARISSAEVALAAARQTLLDVLGSEAPDVPRGAPRRSPPRKAATPPANGKEDAAGAEKARASSLACGPAGPSVDGGFAESRARSEDSAAGKVGADEAKSPRMPQVSLHFLDQAVVSCVAHEGEKRDPAKTSAAGQQHAPSTVYRPACLRCCHVPIFHPESRRVLVWNFVGLLFLVYLVFRIPYDMCFDAKDNKVFLSIVDAYYILDLVVNFFTAYEDEETKTMVTEPCKIACRYLKCWFWFDAAAAIPWDWFDLAETPVLQSSKGLRLLRMARMTRCARLLHLGLLGNRVDMFIEQNPSLSFLIGVLKVLFLLVSVTHWAACAWYYIGSVAGGDHSWVDKVLDEDMDRGKHYVYALYFTLTTMTTVGYGDIVAQNFTEVCFVLVLLLVASIVFASAMGELTDLIRALNAEHNSLFQAKQRLFEYMRWRRVPRKLVLALRTHLVWLWESKAGFDSYEEDIKSELSPILKQELCYHVYGQLLRNAPFLQWLRLYEPCLKELAVLLSSGFLSPGDHIFRVGEANDQIYMLLSGVVRLSMNHNLHHKPLWGDEDNAMGTNEVAITSNAAKKWMRAGRAHNGFRENSLTRMLSRSSESGFDSPRAHKSPRDRPRGLFAFHSRVFSQATKELRQHEAQLSWCARVIQTAWRRSDLRESGNRSGACSSSAMRSKPISAPAYFGEACLWTPCEEWNSVSPHKFRYSAKCESQVEVVYIRRTVIKEIMDKFSPWLEERFEVFRQAVVRSLPTHEDGAAAAKAPRFGPSPAAESDEELSSEGGVDVAVPLGGPQGAPARAPQTPREQEPALPAADTSISSVGRLRRLLNFSPSTTSVPRNRAVDWNFIWNHQAWNQYPGERLVNCAASGGSISGTIKLRHASSVNAEWDGMGVYDEDTIQVEFVNGSRLSGALRCSGASTVVQWSNGMVWTLVQAVQPWEQTPTLGSSRASSGLLRRPWPAARASVGPLRRPLLA